MNLEQRFNQRLIFSFRLTGQDDAHDDQFSPLVFEFSGITFDLKCFKSQRSVAWAGGRIIFQSIQDHPCASHLLFGVSHHFSTKKLTQAFPSKSGFYDNSAEIELKIGSFYEFSVTAKIVVLISQAKGPKILSLLMLEENRRGKSHFKGFSRPKDSIGVIFQPWNQCPEIIWTYMSGF